MIVLLGLIIIGLGLIIGSVQDIKLYRVDRRISNAIFLIGMFLAIYTRAWEQPLEIIAFKVIVISMMYVFWKEDLFGIADLKVMSAIIILFAPLPYIIFISTSILSGLVLFTIMRKNRIPQFIPITFGYVITFIAMSYNTLP